MGKKVQVGVAGFYAAAIALWALAVWLERPQALALLALLPATAHLGWQVLTLKTEDGGDALAKFRSNRFAGLLMALACLVVGT
jgi:4-hydroxybenzoate polyprenyltransferase